MDNMRGSRNPAPAAAVAAAVAAAAASTSGAMSSRRRPQQQSSVGLALSASSADHQQRQELAAGTAVKMTLTNPHSSTGGGGGSGVGSVGGNSGGGGGGGGGGAGELNIDLGDLTQSPRRRVASVPASTVSVYRFMRRTLGLLTCCISVSDVTLAISDIVIGCSMMSGSDQWGCASPEAGRSVFASGITGVVACLGIAFTHYLATGNTVVHSSITALLMVASLGHTCSAMPRLQLSYQAAGCTGKAHAYLLVTGLVRLATLLATGVYYGLLNYYVCRFGEDNTTTITYAGSERHHK